MKLSSYKGHSVFALILSFMFFLNPINIALTIIAANIPDFDHKFKKDSVYKMIISGLIIFITFYILNLPPYIGLIIVFLGVIFYFSNHRSFTHSVFGVFTVASAVGLLVIWSLGLISYFTDINPYLILAFLVILLSFLFLNKKILMIFIPVFLISLFIIPFSNINYITLLLSLFLGLSSHVILDSFTPSGVKLFAPLSSKKFYKNFGISMVIILIILSVIYNLPLINSLFNL